MSLASAQAGLATAILNMINADAGNKTASANDLAAAIINAVLQADVTGVLAPPGTAGGPCSGALK